MRVVCAGVLECEDQVPLFLRDLEMLAELEAGTHPAIPVV